MLIELDAGLARPPASCRRASTSRSTRRCRTSTPTRSSPALDGDTRDYLRLLIAGAGEGLKGNTENLSATFKRFSPTGRDILKITKLLAVRHDNIRRSIHNFSLLSQELGRKDQDSSRGWWSPPTWSSATSPARTRTLREALQPAAEHAARRRTRPDQGQPPRPRPRADTRRAAARRPRARARRWSRRGRSCARRRRSSRTRSGRSRVDAQPTVKLLRPAARDLAKATPKLTTSLERRQRALQRAGLQPAGQRARATCSDRVDEPQRRLAVRHAGRPRPDPPRHRADLAAPRSPRCSDSARSTSSWARSSSC